MLLGVQEGLVHKATGWILREADKRDMAALKEFFARHQKTMPHTAL